MIEYHGAGSARLVLDEYEIIGGTQGAPVAHALAERIENAREVEARVATRAA